jgi:ubiquitin-conjugating enzyme E2 Z
MAAGKRLQKEIAKIGDLSGQGIYYLADESSLYKGHAMVIGPEDSVYANGFLFFRFLFPEDYPFSPPKVTFLSCDGKTRFHPNLYIEGKVCLSILGTYSGPSWQSTMSLSMILLSLKALLDSNPITHEPGYEKFKLDNPKALHYSQYVNAKFTELTYYELKNPRLLALFQEDIPHLLPDLRQKIHETIRENGKFADTQYSFLPYSMSGNTHWRVLLQDLEGVKETR